MVGTALWRSAIAAVLITAVFASLDGSNLAAEPETQTLTEEVEQTAGAAFEDALQRTQTFLSRYGYAAVFGAIFLEGIGIPAPGEMLVLAAFLESAQGSLNIVLLALLTVVAAVAGNSVGYLIGRFGGRRLLLKVPLKRERLDRATVLFDKYGGWFILVARFIDGPRQLNGIIAGMLNMPWWLFSFWNVLGAVLWVLVWGGTAYWLGRDFTKILPLLQRFETAALGLAIATLIVGLFWVWRRRRSRSQMSP